MDSNNVDSMAVLAVAPSDVVAHPGLQAAPGPHAHRLDHVDRLQEVQVQTVGAGADSRSR